MRVAVASLGEELWSPVSERARRSPFFLLFEDGSLVEKWGNLHAGTNESGWLIARALGERHVDEVVAGSFSPSIDVALSEKGIGRRCASGLVGAALRKK